MLLPSAVKKPSETGQGIEGEVHAVRHRGFEHWPT